MPNVKMPDGVVVAFPDNMPPEQIRALILKKFPDAGRPDLYASGNVKRLSGVVRKPNDNYVTQSLSGVNEGIANALGAPVELANMGIGAGMAGANALLGTDFKPSQAPVGGQQFFRDLMSPTIAPPSNDKGQQFARRIMQEAGAMAIPAGGTVAKAAKPLKMAAAELGTALLSGTGAATAQQVAPGNAMAEFGGQMLGSMTPMGLLSLARKATGPKAVTTVEQLTSLKNAAYKKADDLGVAYSGEGYNRLITNIAHAAMADKIHPDRHKAAFTFIEDMVKNADQPLTLTQLDQLRQIVRRDLITPSYGNPAASADAHFGGLILDEIDDFIGSASGKDVLKGSASDANTVILAARELNTRLRKTELLEDAITRAERRAASTGSGGNINNAIRQNIRAILDSPKKRRAFTKAELFEMEALIRQGSMENFLRWVGKFSPGGNGIIGLMQVGGTMINPSLAALPVAGMVAKGIADKGTLNRVNRLRENVSRMPLPKRPPLLSISNRRIAGDLLYAQGANQ